MLSALDFGLSLAFVDGFVCIAAAQSQKVAKGVKKLQRGGNCVHPL